MPPGERGKDPAIKVRVIALLLALDMMFSLCTAAAPEVGTSG